MQKLFENFRSYINEEISISDKELEELKTIKDELHAASKMHKSQAERIEDIIKDLVKEELETVLSEKIKGADGKACWKGYRYAGTEDGKDKCLPMEEELNESEKIDKNSMPCNKPRRTPSHPTKSHVVKACEGGKEKIIRFGEQGASTAGAPKSGESEKMKAKRASFKARHGKNIKKGKMSAAYWADKVKW